MVAFKVAFLSVFVALMYMFPGYLLGKAKKAAAGHLSTLLCIFTIPVMSLLLTFL